MKVDIKSTYRAFVSEKCGLTELSLCQGSGGGDKVINKCKEIHVFVAFDQPLPT